MQAQRKRLESRRLDYDVKKRQRAKKPDDPKSETDFLDAELKFEQAKEMTWNGMAKLMEYEVCYPGISMDKVGSTTRTWILCCTCLATNTCAFPARL